MYYFAYGSNMNLDHMRRLCGWHFRVLGPAAVEGYEFGADLRGFATIHEKKGSKVWGVLFEIDQECLDILDDFEGYPDVFGRYHIEVKDSLGEKLQAWVYIEPKEQFGGPHMREDYVRRAMAGAIENRLPEEWVKFLETFMPK